MISIILPNRNEEKLKLVQEKIAELPFYHQVVIATDHTGDGKGAAIREGLKVAEGDIIVFLDADMDIEPKMILRLLPFIQDYDIVVGDKSLKDVALSRKLLTLLSRIYIRILFGLEINTQTGLKIFKREALPKWKTNGFAFDIEILAKAKRNKKTMIEIPIEAKITKRMPLKSIWKTLKESIKIWLAL